jgi:hypothetical protein
MGSAILALRAAPSVDAKREWKALVFRGEERAW